jgi:uncharacterized protein (TIGR01777 family)
MKMVIAGGTGQLGLIVAKGVVHNGGKVVLISRGAYVGGEFEHVRWDANSHGDWTKSIDGADVVLNLCGRSVNCRYTEENRRQIMDSRVNTTRLIGEAIQRAANPPSVWLQMSTATIYAHRYDEANTEATGIIGGAEPNTPDTWRFSIDVATAWEKACDDIPLPSTRKVKLRSSMVMSPEPGGVFDVLLNLVRSGLGGTNGDGRQYISWITDVDFARALDFILEHEELSGAINVCSPNPVPNAEFMRTLREAWGVPCGLPATEWMLEIGAVFLQTETELILKSRRVVPQRLLDSGFEFNFPEWSDAARSLCARRRLGTGFTPE